LKKGGLDTSGGEKGAPLKKKKMGEKTTEGATEKNETSKRNYRGDGGSFKVKLIPGETVVVEEFPGGTPNKSRRLILGSKGREAENKDAGY